MIEITPALSRKIANVGFVCACLVVSIHLAHPTGGPGRYFDGLLYGGISSVAVPMFFAISGFLLAGKMDSEGWWKREVGKRVRTLVIPFFCWSFIAFAVTVAEKIAISALKGAPLATAIGNVWREGMPWVPLLGLDLTALPSVGALWYVRNLVFFVLLSPIFLKGIRRFGIAFVLALYGFYLAWFAFVMPHLPSALQGFCWYGLSVQGLAWFSLGIWLRLSPPLRLPALGTIVCWFLGVAFWWIARREIPAPLASVIRSLEILVLAYALWMSVPSRKWPSPLVSAAFPIFLMHGIFIGALQMNPSTIPGPASLLGYSIHWLVPIVSSILVAMMFRRWLPRFSGFVFGGR